MATHHNKALVLLALVLATMIVCDFCTKAKALIGFRDVARGLAKGFKDVTGAEEISHAIGGMMKDGKLCGLTMSDMQSCKDAVQKGGDHNTSPSGACCNVLEKADFPCFCGLKDSSLVTKFSVDVTLAIALPGACNIERKFPC
uniref:Bifunctional inhibitor/plant lipid transfer protein/seed storage helical domain-containing protein n=1 Tax=Opuntia streptacantha TaxID=393608 RepID=A0A7C9D4M8_OPUST